MQCMFVKYLALVRRNIMCMLKEGAWRTLSDIYAAYLACFQAYAPVPHAIERVPEILTRL